MQMRFFRKTLSRYPGTCQVDVPRSARGGLRLARELFANYPIDSIFRSYTSKIVLARRRA